MKKWMATIQHVVAMLVIGSSSVMATAQTSAAGMTILNRDQAMAVMPATVFYRGQTASVQGRNSAGIKLAGDRLVLAAVVDTSGYSSTVQQTYQAYLLTEVPLNIGGQMLPPGAYGFGFVAGDRLVVMDIGGNELLRGTTLRDAALARPNPLQMLADAKAGGVRLYMGRSYLTIVPTVGPVVGSLPNAK